MKIMENMKFVENFMYLYVGIVIFIFIICGLYSVL